MMALGSQAQLIESVERLSNHHTGGTFANVRRRLEIRQTTEVSDCEVVESFLVGDYQLGVVEWSRSDLSELAGIHEAGRRASKQAGDFGHPVGKFSVVPLGPVRLIDAEERTRHVRGVEGVSICHR